MQDGFVLVEVEIRQCVAFFSGRLWPKDCQGRIGMTSENNVIKRFLLIIILDVYLIVGSVDLLHRTVWPY